jgi:hypothetical protein
VSGAETAVATQADREAAASAYYAWIGPNPVIPRKMTAGHADGHSMVQAFAQHRVRSQNDLLEALSRAMKWLAICDDVRCEKDFDFAEAALARAKGTAA